MMKSVLFGALGALILDTMRADSAKARLPIIGPVPTIVQGPATGLLSSLFPQAK